MALTAKYSYVPTKQFAGKSVAGDGGIQTTHYFIDSDERRLEFRDQYGKRFVFLPIKTLRYMFFIALAFGAFLGWLI